MDERHARLGYICAVSGLLGVAAAALALGYQPAVNDDQWSYPFRSHAFVWFSLGLAVSHLLSVTAFVAVRGESHLRSRPVVVGIWLSVVGFVGLVGCEVASGSIGGKDVDSSAAHAVGGGFGVTSLLASAGAIAIAVPLLRRHVWTRVGAWSLLLSAAMILFVVTPASIAGNDDLRTAGLLVWSACFVTLGLAIARAGQRTEVALASTA